MTGQFLDTNILLYAYAEDDPKRAVALALLDRGFTISVQSLNEFANAGRRKFRWDWPRLDDSLFDIRALATRIVTIDPDLHDYGIDLAKRYRVSIYDAMIVAAALSGDCETLYSEDMQHGQVIEGRLTIVDPFRPVTPVTDRTSAP